MELPIALKSAQAFTERPHILIKVYGAAKAVSQEVIIDLRQAYHASRDGPETLFRTAVIQVDLLSQHPAGPNPCCFPRIARATELTFRNSITPCPRRAGDIPHPAPFGSGAAAPGFLLFSGARCGCRCADIARRSRFPTLRAKGICG